MAKNPKEIVVEPDSRPDVIAYRVGLLEQTQKEGFQRLELMLQNLRDGFVSHQQMADAIKKAELEHTEFYRRISKLERWNDWLVRLVLGTMILSIIALVIGKNIHLGQ